MDKVLAEDANKIKMEDVNIENVYTEQFVVFKIGKEEYGVDIKKVDTVEHVIPSTRVPKTPYYLKGVINLRGEIVPVLDLRKRFKFPEIEIDEDARIIVFKVNDLKAGIIVDMVDEVLTISEEQLSGNSNITNELSEEYIYAIAKYENRIITLLNVEKLIVLDEEEVY